MNEEQNEENIENTQETQNQIQEQTKEQAPEKIQYQNQININTQNEASKKRTPLVALIILAIVVIAIIVGIYLWYTSSLNAVNVNDKQVKTVEIVSGGGMDGIAKTLKENDLIKNELSFKVYCKLNNANNLQAGTYEFDTSLNVEQIVKKLQAGEIVSKEITIMFPEGKNMRSVAKLIESKTNHTYDEVMELFESKTYAKELISKYWFLTDEILDDNIYYPLEGYLFPDTYTFEDKNVPIEDIMELMLKQTDKILSKYKDQITSKGYTVHKFLSLASVVECEGTNTESRQGIAGVFTNRINRGMALQSDVTTYYAFKVDMGERDLTTRELNTYNKYNTRGPNMQAALPIGPISNVSESSIKATLNPTNTDALFFVADKNGEIYFSKTNEEHEQIINKLKNQGLWYEY